MIRIGMVDFDTSHVGQFTRRLNHVAIGEEQWVDGAQVVMGCPGTSEITDRETIDKYTREMTDDFGIEVVNDPTDMIGKIDAVMVESQDGSDELYDLHNDPLEMINLIGSPAHTLALEQARRALGSWITATGDTWPSIVQPPPRPIMLEPPIR